MSPAKFKSDMLHIRNSVTTLLNSTAYDKLLSFRLEMNKMNKDDTS